MPTRGQQAKRSDSTVATNNGPALKRLRSKPQTQTQIQTQTDDATNTTTGVVTLESGPSMVSQEDELTNMRKLLEQVVQQMVRQQEDINKIKERLGSVEEKVPGDVTNVTTSAVKSDLTAGTDAAFLKHLTNVLRVFIREKFFKFVKFVDEHQAARIVNEAMAENRIHPMDGQTEDGLRSQCRQIVISQFNMLRGTMQSQARRNFLSKIICCFRQLLF